MALWMTVGMECFWLAVMLPVFSCACLYKNKRQGGKGRGIVPAFLCVFISGWVLGTVRMEYEEWIVRTEEAVVQEWEGGTVAVTGEILEISETESGFRILLGGCQGKGKKIRKMYCYTDTADCVKIGMKVRVVGNAKTADPDRNPGSFDYRLYCRSKGICGILYGEQMEIADGRYLAFREWARYAGIMIEGQLERIADMKDIGILKAVLLGNKAEIEEDVYEIYRRNGISHVLAISGLHVSVIGMGLWRGLRKTGMGFTASGLLAFGLLFLYGNIAGFGPSVVRAVLMMGISFMAGICGRTYDLPSAMCVPAIGLLMVYPFLLTQPSFQLSFLAVSAIFFPGDYLAKRWGVSGFWKNILVSASIQIVTAPVVLFHSFEIPVYSLLLNLMVVPLMTYVLVSGLAGTLISFIDMPLGAAALGGAHYILRFYEWIGKNMQKLPGAVLVPGKPTMAAVILFYICLIAGVLLAGKGKKWCLGVCVVGGMILLPVREPGLTVTFLDVGQGDGIFIQAENRTMLVDCGSSQEKEIGEDCLVPFLKSKGITVVDTVVVSHGDQDHISGIRYLLENQDTGIGIGCLIMPEVSGEDQILKELEAIASVRNIPVYYKAAGDQSEKNLGDSVNLRYLHPDKHTDGQPSDRNEDSLVMMVEYGAFRLLLTGDVGIDGENEIMEREDISKVTVLKAGHHGSETSSGEKFISMIKPSYVVFSYGRGNRYGHPAKTVVERCQMEGAEIYETGRSGAVEIWTDGKQIRIRGWLDRPDGI